MEEQKKQQEFNKKTKELNEFEKIDFEKEKANTENRLRKVIAPYNNYEDITSLLEVYKTVSQVEEAFDYFLKQKAIKEFCNHLRNKSKNLLNKIKNLKKRRKLGFVFRDLRLRELHNFRCNLVDLKFLRE